MDRSPDRVVLRGSTRYLAAPDDPVESPAAADIVERASTDRDGPLYVLAIGAATNVAYLCEPDLVPSRLVHSPVLTSDLTWSWDPGRHFVRAAWDIERDDIWRDFFESVNDVDARAP